MKCWNEKLARQQIDKFLISATCNTQLTELNENEANSVKKSLITATNKVGYLFGNFNGSSSLVSRLLSDLPVQV